MEEQREMELDSLRRANARLAAKYATLASAVEKHHSQRADDRCVLDDDEMYAAAGLPPCNRRVGDKFEMVKNCIRFIEHRCEAGGPWKSYAELHAELEAAKKEIERLRKAYFIHENEIQQTLAKPLGFPRYCDDQKNFPGTTERDGRCTGVEVGETLAIQAARLIEGQREECCRLARQNADIIRLLKDFPVHCYATEWNDWMDRRQSALATHVSGAKDGSTNKDKASSGKGSPEDAA